MSCQTATGSGNRKEAGLFPAWINCMCLSSLIFSFVMETSWKHHGNYWVVSRRNPVEPQNEHHKTFSTRRRAPKCDRSRSRAGRRERRAKAEESGLPSHFAAPCRCPQSFFLHGNTWKLLETSWKHMETRWKLLGDCLLRKGL